MGLHSIEKSDIYKDAADKIDYLYRSNSVSETDVFLHKQTELRNRFMNKYNPDSLEKYSGMDVWNKIWEHGPGGMIYALRYDEYLMFGSAKSQDVARLPMYRTKEGNYCAGRKGEIKGLKASLEYADRFRYAFAECIRAVEKMELETIEDFVRLGEFLDDRLDDKGSHMWVHKYLHMFFPEKFSQFHSHEFKRDALCALGIIPERSYYGMAGQLYQIKKRTKINDFALFGQVMYKNFPGIGKDEIYLISANERGVEEINKWETESEIYFDTALFNSLYENARFQQKTDLDDPKNHLFVVVDNGKLIGIVDRLRQNNEKKKITGRFGIWHRCFGEDDNLSEKLIRKVNNKKPLDDPETIILIYDRYYRIHFKATELEEIIRNHHEEYIDEYNNGVKKEVSDLLENYPQNNKLLQEKFRNGVIDFYKELEALGCYDGERIFLGNSLEGKDIPSISIMTLRLILEGADKDITDIPIGLIARALNFFYPERYLSITDKDAIDLALDELGIHTSEGQNIWDRHILLRGWIKEKIEKYTDDALLQNYIFIKCFKRWLGLEFHVPKQVKYSKLRQISKETRRAYEIIEHDENEISQDIIQESEMITYQHTPQEKEYVDEKDSQGRNLPKRDPIKRKNAMVIAGFKCEIDPNHATFISRRSGMPYVESHHFIPMEFHEDFDFSLDVEENIVCLCSNCHNEIHYGVKNAELVRALYIKRKDLLHDVGLDITEEELLTKAYKNYVADYLRIEELL